MKNSCELICMEEHNSPTFYTDGVFRTLHPENLQGTFFFTSLLHFMTLLDQLVTNLAGVPRKYA